MSRFALAVVLASLVACRTTKGGDDELGETGSETATSTSESGSTSSTSESGTSESTTDTDTSTSESAGTSESSTSESTTDTSTSESSTSESTTDTSTSESTSESTGNPIECMGPAVPTDGALLLEWLEGGNYSQWQAESGPHDSTGPHFGNVRTYVHPCLAESLEANQPTHPMGAAAVKELYGENGDVVLGWSVSVKIGEGYANETWYWYEVFEGVVNADSIADPVCTDCHLEGVDKYTSFWPLI
ncbi:hypothetical protein ACNOYE_27345 [Nannocystaceae bacterium ST9]